MWRILQQSIGIFLAGSVVALGSFAEEPASFRHEVSGGIRWFSDAYTADHYITNSEPRPERIETYKKENWRATGVYTLFFRPLAEQAGIPLALQSFYARSSRASLSFFIEPEAETSRNLRDPEIRFVRSTVQDEQSRKADVEVEYFLTDNAGLSLHLAAVKDDARVQTSSTVDTATYQKTGKIEEIRRFYGLGLSYYISENIRAALSYSRLDFEYYSRIKGWPEDRPILFTEEFVDSEPDGHTFALRGTYIFRNVFGIRADYEFDEYQARNRYWSVYSDNFIDLDSYYDDNVNTHRWSTLLSFYITGQTTLQCGVSYSTQTIRQMYEAREQAYDHNTTAITAQMGVFHYLTRHVGLHLGYEAATQTQDVLHWYPENEDGSRTSWEVTRDSFAITCGIIGRL